MKRFGAILVILVCLLCGVVHAEEPPFEYRENIHFGDGHETVQKKESSHGLYNERDHYLEYSYTMVAGIERSTIEYLFDDEDHLNGIYIIFGHERDLKGEELCESDKQRYDAIENGLMTKYGEPVQKQSFAELNCYKFGALYNYLDKEDRIVEGEQRILDYDENNVVIIEHALILVDNRNKKRYVHLLSYQLIERGRKTEGNVLNDL